MTTAQQVEHLTIEEFVRLYEQNGAFEIIDGEWREIMPPVMIHGIIVRTLFLALYNYCQSKQLGEVLQEMPFVLNYDSSWVKGSRSPDVMFFEKSRWDEYVIQVPDWAKKPAILVPDLVVEVISQNDNYSDLNRKVQIYRQDGVKLIWVVDPAKKSVDVYQGNQITTLEADSTLTGSDVLPNLEISLSELFSIVDDGA
jgi:Uma2 family endonuclease